MFSNGSVEVIDYKTNKLTSGLPTPQEVASNLSNLVYYRLAKDLYPKATLITVSLYFLRAERKVSVTYTPEILAEARAELERLVDQLEKGITPPIENLGCSWCLVRKHNRCSLFSHSEQVEAELVF